MENLEPFARLVTALRPWLSQLVVVGGWGHRLHRLHRLAAAPGHMALRTRDTDLAFSADGALTGDVRSALTEAGFAEELLGDDSPPATHYRLQGEDAGFYVEFLTPLLAPDLRREAGPVPIGVVPVGELPSVRIRQRLEPVAVVVGVVGDSPAVGRRFAVPH